MASSTRMRSPSATTSARLDGDARHAAGIGASSEPAATGSAGSTNRARRSNVDAAVADRRHRPRRRRPRRRSGGRYAVDVEHDPGRRLPDHGDAPLEVGRRACRARPTYDTVISVPPTRYAGDCGWDDVAEAGGMRELTARRARCVARRAPPRRRHASQLVDRRALLSVEPLVEQGGVDARRPGTPGRRRMRSSRSAVGGHAVHACPSQHVAHERAGPPRRGSARERRPWRSSRRRWMPTVEPLSKPESTRMPWPSGTSKARQRAGLRAPSRRPGPRRRAGPRRRGRCGCRARLVAAPRPSADGDLQRHQVDADDLLGDRVLDLQSRVHLQEVRGRLGRGSYEELDRAGADVADRLAAAAGGVVQRLAHRLGEPRARAPPRRPSGAGAGSSSRGRRRPRRCRGCRP